MIRFRNHDEEPDEPVEPDAPIEPAPEPIKLRFPLSSIPEPPTQEVVRQDFGGDDPPPPPGKRRGFRWRRFALATLLLIVVTLSGLFYMIRRPPEAWTQYEQYITETNPEQRAQTVGRVIEKLETQLLLDQANGSGLGLALRGANGSNPIQDHAFADLTPEQLAAISFDRSAQVTLNNEELASVMVQWFDEWTRQRGFVPPDGMKPPVIVVLDEKLKLGFEISLEGWRQTFGGEVRLLFRDDGVAEGSVHDFTVGSLPVPLSRVGRTLRDNLGEERAKRAGEWIGKLERFEFRPVLELEHRRRARVTAIQIHPDDTITLTLRVQDHNTYKNHNAQLAAGLTTPNGVLLSPPTGPGETGIADVPTVFE